MYGAQNQGHTKLNLSGTTVKTLYDDKKSWPQPGDLNVSGFSYQDIELCAEPTALQIESRESPRTIRLTADMRIDWLRLQPLELLSAPQPWHQLEKALQERGDSQGAKHVSYIYARLKAKDQIWPIRLATLVNDQVTEDLLRVSLPLISLRVAGSIVFWRAGRMRAMAPISPAMYERFSKKESLENYPPFVPTIYTLENLLPVLKLGQDSAWAPDPATQNEAKTWRRFWRILCAYQFLLILRWSLIMLGWLFALILVGAIGSRFKS